MPSKNLEKLKIMYGNDMYPSIDPKEQLLLDRKLTPGIGDVILFRNRFGMSIAHRLLHKFAGYYFTKGDNCPFFNFPFKEDMILGVVVGKKMPVIRNMAGEISLALFLPYFMLYSRIFDIRRKKAFLPLKFASLFYPHLPSIEEMKRNGRVL